MKKFTVHTTYGRKLSTWGVDQDAAERRVAADLARDSPGEEVYFSSQIPGEPVPKPRRRMF
jgi:hypothetical protein